MKPDENISVPSSDEQDSFYAWVMSHCEGVPDCALIEAVDE